jgi:hypothetical protein
MSVFLQPIYTQTVGAGGAASITFNNIPQTFTDLKIIVSSRTSNTGATDSLGMYINGVQTNRSNTLLYGNGSGAFSVRGTYRDVGTSDAGGSTSNTFSNIEIYIPNYISSNYKQIISDSVEETNAAATTLEMRANLWSSTAAITSLSFDCASSGLNFVQYSTFSLYGVLRQGI